MKLIFSWTLFLIILTEICNEEIPNYLSIKLDTDRSRSQIYDFIERNMKLLVARYSEDKEISNDLKDIKALISLKFKEPDSWHITCLYIGDNKTAVYDPIYVNFKEGVKLDFDVSTMIYIPGKIILAPVFPNYSLIQNKYPHVTILLGEYFAVDSNYILRYLFAENEELKLLYQNGKIKDKRFLMNEKLENVRIKFDSTGREELLPRVYIIKSENYLDLIGTTTKNY